MKKSDTKKMVQKEYGKLAKESKSCCSGCGCGQDSSKLISKGMGYSEKEMDNVPEDSNLGLGCGNPVAIASLKKGETVMDLGSGAGFDSFLAAAKVGEKGRVIGVDMTAEMIKKARLNARKGGYKNVEFLKGDIENIPVDDCAVDIIISNCVINLSPDKSRVFEEAFRVLRSGGRIMVADIVLGDKLPEVILKSIEGYIGCVSGAMLKKKYIDVIKKAGFENIKILSEDFFPIDFIVDKPEVQALVKKSKINEKDIKALKKKVLSVKISAIKPRDKN